MSKKKVTNCRGGGGHRRVGGGRRRGGYRGRGSKDSGSAAARKKIQDFYEKLGKRKHYQKTSNKSINIDKTSILEELRKNGRRHQILREKLPL